MRFIVGRRANVLQASGLILFFSYCKKPLLLSLCIRDSIGALIVTLTSPTRLFHPFTLRVLIDLRSRFVPINTPRNFADSFLRLVIRVFSNESSNFKLFKKTPSSCFKNFTKLRGPHTPTNQSSAYLTYSILIQRGFGIK